MVFIDRFSLFRFCPWAKFPSSLSFDIGRYSAADVGHYCEFLRVCISVFCELYFSDSTVQWHADLVRQVLAKAVDFSDSVFCISVFCISVFYISVFYELYFSDSTGMQI